MARRGVPLGPGWDHGGGAQPHSRRVLKGHFKNQLWREGEELRGLIGALQQQREDVEAATAGAPAVLDAELGDSSVREGQHQGGLGGPGVGGWVGCLSTSVMSTLAGSPCTEPSGCRYPA